MQGILLFAWTIQVVSVNHATRWTVGENHTWHCMVLMDCTGQLVVCMDNVSCVSQPCNWLDCGREPYMALHGDNALCMLSSCLHGQCELCQSAMQPAGLWERTIHGIAWL